MADEKDLEIARLQGRLEAAEARKGGAAVGTLKVVGTLALLALAIVVVLAVVGAMNPPRTLAERMGDWEAQIQAKCDVRWTKTEDARDSCVVIERQTRPLPAT